MAGKGFPQGVMIFPNFEDTSFLKASIDGPEGSSY
jgi:hypothetical protein